MKKEFKKSDLKTGMVVETAIGQLYLVWSNTIVNDGGIPLSEYDDNLNHTVTGWEDEKIMKVYREPDGGLQASFDFLLNGKNVLTNCTLLWERQEQLPEYTIEELIEKVGHEFKIKK